MAYPTSLTPVQVDLYGQLYAWQAEDPANDWHLLKYIGAISAMFDQIAGYALDTTDGWPGWAILLDVDRCPVEALDWLGQFVGVQPVPIAVGETQTAYVARKREVIRAAEGLNRGTVKAMIQAAQMTLTGTKKVYLNERSGGAYNLSIATLASETPNSALTQAALVAQKPAGIILTYNTIVGGDFLTLRNTHTDFTTVRSHFTDFLALRTDPSL